MGGGIVSNGDGRPRAHNHLHYHHHHHHYYHFIIMVLFLTVSESVALKPYRTANACEGSLLNISCASGHIITIIRANYGRFSITICNDHGNTDWSVNCHSPSTYTVLVEKCSGRDSCSLEINNGVFGDPCPDTRKYIEVHYLCGLALSTSTVTTAHPRPPWFVATQSPLHSTTTIDVNDNNNNNSNTTPYTLPITTTTSTTISASATSTKSTTSLPRTTVTHVDEGVRVNSDFNPPKDNKHPIIIPLHSTQSPAILSCHPIYGRGLFWNWTQSGEVSEQPCPGGALGNARWSCHSGRWAKTVDMSECRSVWLTSLETRATSQDSLLGVASDLATVTSSRALYGGDLTTTARLLSKLITRMKNQLQFYPNPQQRQVLVEEMLQSSLSTGSALLAEGLEGSWGDLGTKDQRRTVTQLMLVYERIGFLLANLMLPTTQMAYRRSHVMISIRVVATDGSTVKFPSIQDRALDWEFPDSVTLSSKAVLENSIGGNTRIVFLTYRHLEDLLAPSEDDIGSKSLNMKRMVNSRVVSASFGLGQHIALQEPVILTFSLLRQNNLARPVCVFWNYNTTAWSDEGCSVLHHNHSHVSCQCYHLTNFAVLMEEVATGRSQNINSSLHIMVYVGCVVGLIFVGGALLIFPVLCGLMSSRSFLHRHVCLCLSVAVLVFVVGVWQTDIPVVCGLVAGMLHYSLLAAFTWMVVEGVYVYMSVACTMECEALRLRWWHYILIYGFPLLVVVAAALVDPFSYGTREYCWLRTDNYFVFSLVGPAVLLLVAHAVLVGATFIHTYRLSHNEALKAKEVVV